MLTRANKVKQIQFLESQLGKVEGTFVIEFSKMQADQMTDFRTQLRSKGAQLKVIRNTLANRALESHPKVKEVYQNSIKQGSNAFVLAFEDVSATAKVLSEFSKEIKTLNLKKGMIGSKVLSKEEIEQLAQLPSLEVLRAQFLSLLQTPGTQMVRVLSETSASMARVLKVKGETNK